MISYSESPLYIAQFSEVVNIGELTISGLTVVVESLDSLPGRVSGLSLSSLANVCTLTIELGIQS